MNGIPFKPDMIKAIVEERKTQARRLSGLAKVNQEPDTWCSPMSNTAGTAWLFSPQPGGIGISVKSRYQVGEVVYIKEAICFECYGETSPKFCCFKEEHNKDCDSAIWHSPLFLPERVARYFLKITDVRPERLQEITSEDCRAEGLTAASYELWKVANIETFWRGRYQRLWDSLYPKQTWASNPWNFVYTFELVDKPKEEKEQ